MSSLGDRLLDIALLVVSALLVIAGFSAFQYGWVAWFALVPLLAALERAEGPKFAFLYGTGWALLWLIPALLWLRNFGFSAVLALSVFLCFAYGVLGLFSHHVLRRFTVGWAALGITAFALLQEYMHEFGTWGFPWFKFAYTQAEFALLYQSADLFGAALLSGLVVAANVLLYKVVTAPRETLKSWPGVTVFAVLFALNWGYGYWRLSEWRPPRDAETLKVAAVQGGRSTLAGWTTGFSRSMIDHYTSLTRNGLEDAAPAERPELVLLPETAMPGVIGVPQGSMVPEKLERVAENFGTNVVFGTMAARHVREVEPSAEDRSADFYGSSADLQSWQRDTFTRGRVVRRADGSRGKYWISTSLAALDDSGEYTDVRGKVKLVPYGETVPFGGDLFQFLEFPWGEFDQAATESLEPLRVDEYTLGTMICYDSIYPVVGVEQVRRGAELILVGTNNSWYLKRDPDRPEWIDPIGRIGVVQHTVTDRFRAVETGRYLVRAATTGISQIVDPRGRIMRKTGIGPEAFLTERVHLLEGKTLYVRIGDVLYQLAGLLALGLLGWFGVFGDSEPLL